MKKNKGRRQSVDLKKNRGRGNNLELQRRIKEDDLVGEVQMLGGRFGLQICSSEEEQRKTIWLEKNKQWVDDLAGEEQTLGGEEEEEERTVGNKMVELKS